VHQIASTVRTVSPVMKMSQDSARRSFLPLRLRQEEITTSGCRAAP
jgi:hypothetical protein